MINTIEKHPHKQKQFRCYFALAGIFGGILLGTAILRWFYGWNFHEAMADFMGLFFLTFSAFKLINLPAFITAYQTYDVVAKRSKLYATIYPFIELALGFAYLFRIFLPVTNVVTIILMLISSIGVIQTLLKKETFQCACLGTIIDLPLTYVTLTEDLLMGIMAVIMLFF